MRPDEVIRDYAKDQDTVRRFWKKVHKGQSCWTWIGAKHEQGYGVLFVKGGTRLRAHRLSWILHNGDIPQGLWVLHRCDNTRCVNPKHMYVGTHADNMRDCIDRRTMRHGEGHPNRVVSEADVREIRALSGSMSFVAIGKRYGISARTACDIAHRVWWKHVD